MIVELGVELGALVIADAKQKGGQIDAVKGPNSIKKEEDNCLTWNVWGKSSLQQFLEL